MTSSADVDLRPALDDYSTPRRRGLPGFSVLLLIVLVAAPLLTTDLQLRRFSQVLVLVLAVLGVNICTGFGGLVSLGHGAFVGIGAFTMANLIDDLSLPLPLALVGSALVAGGFGMVLGLPALRVKGVYLALLTFGFALVLGPVARRMGSLTGGVTGRSVEFDSAPPGWTGLGADQVQLYRYLVCLIVVGLWFAAAWALINSRMGRAIRAVRDDEVAAVTFGVDLTAVKTGTFGLSAAMAGTAGALQAFLFPFVSHTNFDVFLSLRLYAAAVIGGLGVLVGAVYGVIALLIVPVLNSFLGFIGSEAAIFGLGLIMLTYLAPGGLADLVDRGVERVRAWRR
jgi:branched-chain amino acid transport system permease protein